MDQDKFVERIRGADKNDGGVFAEILREALNDGCVGEKDLASAFDVSLPTIRRWRAGLSAPHRFMRPAIYNWLIEKFSEKQ